MRTTVVGCDIGGRWLATLSLAAIVFQRSPPSAYLIEGHPEADLNGTCEFCGASMPTELEAQHLLSHARALFNQPSDEQAAFAGMTALHRASMSGDGTAVQREIDQGHDVNALDKDGWTSLFYAAHADSFDAATVLLDAGADPAHRAKDGTWAWQYGRDELSSFLGEILSPPFPELRQRGFTYQHLAEPYRRFRTARLAGSPVPDKDRTAYFIDVLEKARRDSPPPRSAASRQDTLGSVDATQADERTLRDFEVHWAHVRLTTHGLWVASQRQIGSEFAFDSSVERVRWADVVGVGVHRRDDPDSLRPWARRHVVSVRSRGGSEIRIWCKNEDQAYEIASQIDKLAGHS